MFTKQFCEFPDTGHSAKVVSQQPRQSGLFSFEAAMNTFLNVLPPLAVAVFTIDENPSPYGPKSAVCEDLGRFSSSEDNPD